MYTIKDRINHIFKQNSMKVIFLLAIPAIIENISQVFIGVVDFYLVGKLGTQAIAAVGVTNLTMNIYISFFLALGIGTTAMVARFVGANDYKSTNEAIKQSLMMAIGIGLFFGLVNLIFSKHILLLLGAEKKVVEYALPYFISVAVPSVFLSVTMVLSSALRGAGDTKTPMKIALISNIVNAILTYFLIFGIYDFQGIGILGAGVATTVARIISVILLVRKINNESSRLELTLTKSFKIDFRLLKSITKISFPAAIEKLIMRSGQLIYGSLIIKIGTNAYASHNIAGTIETLSYLPGMGFGVAAATLVGQNLGRNNKDEAKRIGLISYYFSTIVMVVLGLVFYIYAPFFARLFTKDIEVISQVVQVLRLIALFQPFLSMTLVITSALQGAGDTKFPMYASFIGIWGIRVIGVYLLGIRFNYGLVGVWVAYAIDITIRGILLYYRFIKGHWQSIKLSEEKEGVKNARSQSSK